MYELRLALVTVCESCVYPSGSSFRLTSLHFIPCPSLLMAKLVAICKLSETDIQISPLTITPPAFDKIQMQGASMRTKSESESLSAQFVETLLLLRTGLNDNPA